MILLRQISLLFVAANAQPWKIDQL